MLYNIKVAGIIGCLFLLFGCAGSRSVRNVTFEDIAADGSSTILHINSELLPGEKAEGEGVAGLVITASGDWKVDMGQKHKTDLTGTAAMIQSQNRAWAELFKFLGSMGLRAAPVPVP